MKSIKQITLFNKFFKLKLATPVRDGILAGLFIMLLTGSTGSVLYFFGRDALKLEVQSYLKNIAATAAEFTDTQCINTLLSQSSVILLITKLSQIHILNHYQLKLVVVEITDWKSLTTLKRY